MQTDNGKKIRVLLVDDNEDFLQLLTEYIHTHSDIEVIYKAKDGIEGLDKALELKPDVMVLDLVMPRLDGLGVLEKISEMEKEANGNLWGGKRPGMIVLTAIGLESMIKKVLANGADYYIVKPFNMDLLIKRINDIGDKQKVDHMFERNGQACALSSHRLESKVTDVLSTLGIPSNILGYMFLREAIMMVIDQGTIKGSITKKIYPVIAENNNTTVSRVERAIRHSIEMVWTKGNIDFINQVFGHTVDAEKGRPTNGAFIARMADKIRLDLISA